jgi:hypothetical protein
MFIHRRRKNIANTMYSSKARINASRGKASIKKEKNKNSAMKNKDPGNPRNTIQLAKVSRNNFGQRKLSPEISVTSLVLNRLAMASTIKKELVEIIAWLISIANPESHRYDWPLTTQMRSQCISTTVQKATSFLMSIW